MKGTSLMTQPDYQGVLNITDRAADTIAITASEALDRLFSKKSGMLAGITKSAALGVEREVRASLTKTPDFIKSSVEPEEIEQYWIINSKDGQSSVRVRKTTQGQDVSHTMTAKHKKGYAEAETEISPEIFESLKDGCEAFEIKKRYKWNGWDIDDITGGKRAGTVSAEYELPDGENSIELPKELREVYKKC